MIVSRMTRYELRYSAAPQGVSLESHIHIAKLKDIEISIRRGVLGHFPVIGTQAGRG
jgi:hypothetical protein